MPSATRTIYFKEAQQRWELQASPAAFHVDGNGKCTDTVTVVLYSVKGTERTEVDGGTVTVYYDGESMGNFTLPLKIHASGSGGDEQNLYVARALEESPDYFVVGGVNGSNDLEIPVIYDGAPGQKGEKGAVLRGPQAWSDLPVGYEFYAGAEGEEIKDVVLYNGSYFSCIKSHTKSATNYPLSDEDTANGYWAKGDKVELIATKILFSTYALVKNLGVEAIEMKDASNNVLFEAKDGKVTCKTGTFENITVGGTVKASLMYGKVVKCDFSKSGDNTYTIDPATEPGTTFIPWEGKSVNSKILLPKASDYDGLEINVCMMITGPMTRLALANAQVIIGCSSSSDKIYVKKNIDFDQSTVINDTRVYLANVLEPYTAETNVVLAYNNYAKFASLDGAWWAIIGNFYK